MHPSNPSKRRRRELPLGAETLETRELLTAGAGNSFAIVPAEVVKAGQPTALKFTIDKSHFTVPKGRLVLGIDVVASAGSTVTPKVVNVKDPNGMVVRDTRQGTYDPKVQDLTASKSRYTSAVTTTLRVNTGPTAKPQTYTVNVSGKNDTTGKLLVGYYLPGDSNGDGTVNQADVKAIKSQIGAKAGDSRYSFDSDANRDGRITMTDLMATIQNQGVKTTISPIVSANLDDSTDPLLKSGRSTTKPDVCFTGTATPGATITFNDAAGLTAPVSTTADGKGDYKATVPLAPGPNTFQISTLDSFGQSITGTISPVTYSTSTPVTPASLAALGAQVGQPSQGNSTGQS